MTSPHNNPLPSVEPETQPIGGNPWGAPVPVAEKRTPWSAKKIIISAAVAVAIVAGGTAAVVAATNNGSSSSGNGGGPGGNFAGGMGGRFAAGAGLANALHGDFVVSNGSNGYTTERLQTGTVTAVSATSLTVKSADGYTQSYVVGSSTSVDRGSDTISKVATGNTVTVVATLSGQTATASTVEDSSIDSNSGGAGSGQGGFGGNGGTPPSGAGAPPGN